MDIWLENGPRVLPWAIGMNPKWKGHYAEPSPMAKTLGRWPALIARTVQGVWEAGRNEQGLSRLERSKQWPDVLWGTEASEAKPHSCRFSRAAMRTGWEDLSFAKGSN